MRFVVVMLVALACGTARAAQVTFSLSDRSMAQLDGQESLSLASGSLTATIRAVAPGSSILQYTVSKGPGYFGVNQLSAEDNAALIDGDAGAESIEVRFDYDVSVDEIRLALFDGAKVNPAAFAETALACMGDRPAVLLVGTSLTTDAYQFTSDNVIPAGEALVIGWSTGNGFSFDGFTVSHNPEPGAASMLAAAAGLGALRRRRRVTTSPAGTPRP